MDKPPYRKCKRGTGSHRRPTIADDLFHWTDIVLNKKTPSLNNNKICPYAYQAWDRSKVVVIDATGNLFNVAKYMKKHFFHYQSVRGSEPNYEIIIIVDFAFNEYSEETMFEKTQKLLDQENNGVWLIPFHPDAEENTPILDYDDNDYEPLIEQDYAMLFVQSTSHLNQASKFLERKGYYQNWNPEDFNEILTRRSYENGYGKRKRAWQKKR